MLLAVDIGNTNTVAGVFDGDTLVAQWRLATDPERMPDEYAALAAPLFAIAHVACTSIDGAILAGVVPGAQSSLREAVERYLNVSPLIVSTALDLGIEIRYGAPTTVGADRLANAVAAVHRYGAPAVVVDFGTGTNFDAVAADGAYVGGAIAPGIEISMDALFSRTAQLPHIPLVAPEHAIGSSTISGLQSGIIFGYAGLVDGLVERLGKELGERLHVIATGGLAPVVAPHARTVQHIDLGLTLDGLYLIYSRNTRATVD